ncbi:MAG: YcgN family cysteine cluster protein [Gammaproteobacteria bacterium]|nr:YcgN family cysteine cluster protein [Gammaproteobacteria bacterium]MCP5458926.1 YcgN family cysteine cluster protein [Gammaproteobacteria bacterium]
MADFWLSKSLAEMTPVEWESLCDGCGKCCLHKLEDADTGELFFTNVACRLLDLKSCRCRHYAQRTLCVPDCLQLTPESIAQITWLPDTCAYRLLAEGRELPEWHPLRTGDAHSVQRARKSVRGRAISELRVHALEEHILKKPL